MRNKWDFTVEAIYKNSLDKSAFVFHHELQVSRCEITGTLVFCSSAVFKSEDDASASLLSYYAQFTEPADWSLLSPVWSEMGQTS